jgi:transcriptional regulator of met regulon
LQECLGFEEFDKSQLIHFGLIEPEEYEYFAVLALMIICEAVHSNPITVSKHYRIEPTVSQIKAIGHATINAVEAIAYAKRVQFEQKIRTSVALEQPEILANELSRRTSERAVNAANKRHAANNNARDWVCKEWALHCEDYAGNKSEFSRIYAARVKNEFTNSKGEPFSVTDKTIREVWLKNTPTTGK